MPRISGVEIVRAAPQVARKQRKPRHEFNVRWRPWQIQPVMIAPVLAGETLVSGIIQARIVSDPMKNPLIGSWLETFTFYVKHRDLQQQALLDMHVKGTSIAALNSAASVPYYHPGNAPNWTQLCLDRVVEEYFREEGEASLAAAIDGIPVAAINKDGWFDSIVDATTVTTATAVSDDLPGEVDFIPDGIPAGYEDEFAFWQHMQATQLTALTFEDYLKAQGIKAAPELDVEVINKPELVRYTKDFAYPANTIDPTTGTPTSAFSWSMAERMDKKRFFAEPGFLLTVVVFRPKVYLGKQIGSAASLLTTAERWLPAALLTEHYASLVQMPNGAGGGLIEGATNAAWVDLRDLFVHGDQFINYARTATDANLVAMPTAALGKRYAAATDADALFFDAVSGKKLIRADGVISLNILSRVKDTSL